MANTDSEPKKDIRFILVNIRGTIVPMTQTDYDDFKKDHSWMDDLFDVSC